MVNKQFVAMVIPNWNGADYISACLKSLENQSLKPHIIVVDNGSHDESVNIIKTGFKNVELLEYPDNAGFAGGVNRGIRKAIKDKYKYVVLFNNDAVADKNWLENLVSVAEAHEEVGIVTGKFIRMDKKYIDSTGDFYTMWGMPFPRGRNQIDNSQYDTPEYVFGATGGASLYRTEMLEEIGLFDEDFFAYFEDIDISLRAQLAGWKVWYEPKAVAYHHVSATSSKLGNFSRYHSLKNFYLVWMKCLPWQLGVLYSPFIFLQSLRLLATSVIKARSLIFFKSFAKVVQLLPSTIKKRRKIQSSRKVSVGYINSIISKKFPPIIKKV